jgi:hypothetical protein
VKIKQIPGKEELLRGKKNSIDRKNIRQAGGNPSKGRISVKREEIRRNEEIPPKGGNSPIVK